VYTFLNPPGVVQSPGASCPKETPPLLLHAQISNWRSAEKRLSGGTMCALTWM
jgi:hypothetical protein